MRRLLLVSGTMRSGTSMLADILYSRHLRVARHPHVAFSMEGIPLYRNTQKELWALEVNAPLRYKPDALPTIPAEGHDFELLGRISSEQEFVTTLVDQVEAEILNACPEAPEADVFGLKYTNIFNEFILISKYRPDAKLLLTVRDPRDVFASHCKRLGETSPPRRMKIVLDMIGLHDFILTHGQRPDIKVVRYEDVVTNIDQSITDIMTFIGVAPDLYDRDSLVEKGMLQNSSFGAADPGRITTVRHEGTMTARYKSTLTPEEVAMLELLFGDVMDTYGYKKDFDPADGFSQQAFADFQPLLTRLLRKNFFPRTTLDRVAALEQPLALPE
ncbi:sulfotransferase [Novispirillum sp. DQ9]|uniref:sulfotransferase n=1 Tax=Novispirillum sp. DQ9 TaxID=3398612 RepID=UPI003C7A82B6